MLVLERPGITDPAVTLPLSELAAALPLDPAAALPRLPVLPVLPGAAAASPASGKATSAASDAPTTPGVVDVSPRVSDLNPTWKKIPLHLESGDQ